MTLGEIAAIPEFSQMQGQFVTSNMGDWMKGKETLALQQLHEQNPTWSVEDMCFGLNRLLEIAQTGKQYVFPVSDHAALIHLPAQKRKYDTYAILMAGGAYGAVCTMVEALPVAAKLNELGMDCFCLNYCTASKLDFVKGLMPKPLEDVAAAWKYIKARETDFDLCAENYIAGGFSAGGHLSAMWGTSHRGARHFDVPAPKLLLLGYPLITMETMKGPGATLIATGMFGAGFSRKKVREYAVNDHVDAKYPPVYLVQAENDDTVPIAQSYLMEEALRSAEIACKMNRTASGGHGFGLGSATEANGWVEDAFLWMEGLYGL